MATMAAWKDWASFFKFNSSVVEKSQKNDHAFFPFIRIIW